MFVFSQLVIRDVTGFMDSLKAPRDTRLETRP